MQIRVRYFSECGPRRKQNQDNYYVDGLVNESGAASSYGSVVLNLRESRLLAVFDGMGGEADGAEASLAAAENAGIIKEALRAACVQGAVGGIKSRGSSVAGCVGSGAECGEFQDRLFEALGSYYEVFLDELKRRTQAGCGIISGTTCVGMITEDTKCLFFWCGDSRGYLLRNERLRQVSRDDTVAQAVIDNGLISEREARIGRGWHTLTAYMGAEYEQFSVWPCMEMEMSGGKEDKRGAGSGRTTEQSGQGTKWLTDGMSRNSREDTGENADDGAVVLADGDRIVLCSDGLTDSFYNEELEKLLQGDIDDVCGRLKRFAGESAADNCTVIIADIIADVQDGIMERIRGLVREISHIKNRQSL